MNHGQGGGHAGHMLPNIIGLEAAAGAPIVDSLPAHHDGAFAARMLNQLKESTLPAARTRVVPGSHTGNQHMSASIPHSHPAMPYPTAGSAVRSDGQNGQTAAKPSGRNKSNASKSAAPQDPQDLSGEEVRRRNDRNKKRRKRSRIADLIKTVCPQTLSSCVPSPCWLRVADEFPVLCLLLT
jgi:hypothetical protein